MSLRTWLQEPVTAQGRTRAWRIWFWGFQLPLAGLGELSSGLSSGLSPWLVGLLCKKF